ncbi:NAD-dependent epimerase/dehydratase family protein [Brucella pituitosa]|uniref:NAD(P)H-binding protein n=1 Tax=Brucella pituitosa TaxID=571256 RepID=A0A643F6G2_9HYPH|nr:NAD-dependent epimerase/dehydratase family protein [Brucella pituitosa]KAB0573474.1 NAD(P)H-binding protein [Brucella pituitosa]
MRIAVTGAHGFIGSAVLRQLVNDGHETVALSRNDLPAPDFSDVEVVISRATRKSQPWQQRRRKFSSSVRRPLAAGCAPSAAMVWQVLPLAASWQSIRS